MSILFDYSIEYKGLLMHTIMQEIKGICFLKLWFCEIAYPSGKYYMLPDILEIISGSKKTVLVDVFGGSGKVLMNADTKVKIYNDLNADLVSFFIQVWNKRDAVIEKLNYVLHSRDLISRYIERTDDPAENAFRYFYRNILSFNYQSKSFSYSTNKNKLLKLLKAEETINSLFDEIILWTIEKLDFRDLIERMIRRGDFLLS